MVCASRAAGSRVQGRTGWSILCFLLAFAVLNWNCVQAAQPTLTWDHEDSSLTAGFRVYYGPTSGHYDKMVDVGLNQYWTLQGLTAGVTYYFAVTAYDTDGHESAFSREVSYTLPEVDSDGDGLTDGQEQQTYHTDPNAADTDGDGIADGNEVQYWGDSWAEDADGDGVVNLLDWDADGDGYADGTEVMQGFDPGSSGSMPGPILTTTVYEDAEDAAVDGWSLYGGNSPEASIDNVYDEDRDSRVIQLIGPGIDQGYMLRTASFEPWHNAWEPVLEWSMKVTNDFLVYVDVDTSAGHRYLYYTASDQDQLGTGEYIHHGLGADTTLGQWFTFVRDLQADLEEAQPGEMLLEVNAFLVRGNCRVDDIQLHNLLPEPADTDGDRLADAMETTHYGTDPDRKDSDGDGLSDGYEVEYWGEHWQEDLDGDGRNNLLDGDSDNDGFADGEEIQRGSDPADSTDVPAQGATVYEDAEDRSTQRWRIVQDATAAAQVKNVYDKARGSRVIKFRSDALQDAFVLTTASGEGWSNRSQFTVEWSIRAKGDHIVYLDCETTAGHRYLEYRPNDSDLLGSGEYVRFALDSSVTSDDWITIRRDLQADLSAAQPGVEITQINALIFRGNGRLDDIKLMDSQR